MSLLLLGMFLAAGCSSSNNSNSGLNLVTPQGNHPAGWLAFSGPSLHSKEATEGFIREGSIDLCASCHGDDLAGGISRTDCLTTCHHNARFTQFVNWSNPAVHGASAKKAPGSSSFFSCKICHGNDFTSGGAEVACSDCHGVSAPHPAAPWRAPASVFTHTNTDPSNAPVCAACHFLGSPNNPSGHPPNPAPAGTPPGCFNNTLCHGSELVNHALPFFDNTHFQATTETYTSNCSNCHVDAATLPDASPPGCQVCHTAGSPLTLTDCTSCHAQPPAGSAYPNLAGAHAVHLALNSLGTPVSCDTCHNGLGTNTLNHYNRANARSGEDALRVPPGDAVFLATYDAETGASSFDNAALSCSNIRCHGGQARSGGTPGTPLNWQTGALDVNSQCTSCHASGTTQFNSYNSGEHTSVGAHVGAGCIACHNTTTLAVNHFTTLSTTAMEGPASATIGGGTTSVVTYVPATRSCTPTCHDTETW